MAEPKKYTYVRLRDCLSAVACNVNVWGVVSRIEPPRATRGTDLLMSVWIIDPSTDSEATNDHQGVEIRFWAPEKIYQTATPCMAKLGDILRVHRATVREYDGKRFLEVKVARSTIGSAWILLHGALDADETPYFKSSNTCTYTDTDRLMLRSLRAFLAERQLLAPVEAPLPLAHREAVATDKYLKTVYALDPKDTPFADVVGQVMGVDIRAGCTVLYVWDGTDAKPHPSDLTTVDVARAVMTPQRFEMPLMPTEGCQVVDRYWKIPSLGSLVPVLDVKGRMGPPALTALNRWVRLRNVAVTVVQGQVQLLYTANSGWKFLDPRDPVVENVCKVYMEIIKPRRMVAGNSSWNAELWAARTSFTSHEIQGTHPAAEVGSYDFPLSTLREVRTTCITNDRKDDPTDRLDRIAFASLVRVAHVVVPPPNGTACPYVRAARPMAALQVLGPGADEAAAPFLSSLPEFVFNIELVLEDATSRLVVRLCSPHADHLLGVPADLAARDPAAAVRVHETLAMLQRGFHPDLVRPQAEEDRQWLTARSGPWMEVGIQAVKVQRVDCETRLSSPQWHFLLVRTDFSETALRLDRLFVKGPGGGGEDGGLATMA